MSLRLSIRHIVGISTFYLTSDDQQEFIAVGCTAVPYVSVFSRGCAQCSKGDLEGHPDCPDEEEYCSVIYGERESQAYDCAAIKKELLCLLSSCHSAEEAHIAACSFFDVIS